MEITDSMGCVLIVTDGGRVSQHKTLGYSPEGPRECQRIRHLHRVQGWIPLLCQSWEWNRSGKTTRWMYVPSPAWVNP